jgi:hypothetical protein
LRQALEMFQGLGLRPGIDRVHERLTGLTAL